MRLDEPSSLPANAGRATGDGNGGHQEAPYQPEIEDFGGGGA
jgi:hypothetical protein